MVRSGIRYSLSHLDRLNRDSGLITRAHGKSNASFRWGGGCPRRQKPLRKSTEPLNSPSTAASSHHSSQEHGCEDVSAGREPLELNIPLNGQANG